MKVLLGNTNTSILWVDVLGTWTRFMLQKIQFSCISLFNILLSLKIYIISILETFLWSGKECTNYFEYCINDLLQNTVSITVWHILSIGATVNCLLLIITVVNKKMLHVLLSFMANFDIIYGWNAQLLLYCNQKSTLLGIFSKQKLLVLKDWYVKLWCPQFFLGNWPFSHSNGTSFEAKLCKWYFSIELESFWVYFVSGLICIVGFVLLFCLLENQNAW